MTMNHVNLVVANVEAATSFFETYFEFTCTSVKGTNIIAILENNKGFSLVLSTVKNGDVAYPKDFHIGFMQETPEQVQRVYNLLKSGGIELGRPPGKIRNSYGFYFYFDKVFIEVGCASD